MFLFSLYANHNGFCMPKKTSLERVFMGERADKEYEICLVELVFPSSIEFLTKIQFCNIENCAFAVYRWSCIEVTSLLNRI